MLFYQENCLLRDGSRDCKCDCGHCGFDKKISEDRMTWLRTFGLSAVGRIRKLIVPKNFEEV